MFAEIFQRQENKIKECGLKIVNKVRASNFLAGEGARISSYASENSVPQPVCRETVLRRSHWGTLTEACTPYFGRL